MRENHACSIMNAQPSHTFKETCAGGKLKAMKSNAGSPNPLGIKILIDQ
jgi:hypothetical protein